MQPTFLYFAYGSNLLIARLRERTPSARPIGVGILRQHALRWHKVAADDSGKCDVIQDAAPHSHVQGVVYEIASAEKPLLDAAETLGTGYGREACCGRSRARPVDAWVYYALRIDPDAVPYDWYKALVVSGAREHRLAPRYIETLEAVHAKSDPDAVRAARHFSLAMPDDCAAERSRSVSWSEPSRCGAT